ncbi:MAG: phosphate signaling complex protein PhoU [Gammaproteobacteria bacterium]|nr:phosphate signaling complex protein PhoU [Gammaproteobacteria bacterium]
MAGEIHKGHIYHRFDAELADLRSKVLTMGGLVEQQLADALRALSELDRDLAERVVAGDLEVNGLDVDIDEEATLIIARRQPAAIDLRLILTVLRVTNDLERIGDEAERVARMAARIVEAGEGSGHANKLGHIAQRVTRMLHDALDAFARLDVELALRVAREDADVDRDYEGIMRLMITYMMEDPRTIPAMLNMLWAARAIERIGDRSRNICEYVIYLVKGKDVRHTSVEHMAEEMERR